MKMIKNNNDDNNNYKNDLLKKFDLLLSTEKLPPFKRCPQDTIDYIKDFSLFFLDDDDDDENLSKIPDLEQKIIEKERRISL